MMPSSVLGLALGLLASSPSAGPGEPAAQDAAAARSLVSVSLEDATPARLRALGFDLAAVRREETGARVELVAGPDDLARLAELGFSYEMIHRDLARFYAERARAEGEPDAPPALGAWLSPPFASGSMGSYYTLAEVVSVLDQIAAAYPAITTSRFSIGTSIEGRPLWAIKVSDNPDVDEAEPEVRFDSLHHAREPQSLHSSLWMLLFLVENYGTDPLATYLVDERETWFVPVVNPDGYEYNRSTNPGGGGLWRKNRRDNGSGSFGVDLNRNYAFQWGFDNLGSSSNPFDEDYRGTGPASEPETQAMQAFLDGRSFATALSSHTHGNLWLHPWGYTAALPANNADYLEVGALATANSGYTYGPAAATLYPANGDTIDYDHGVHGTMAWVPEIGTSNDGFWPPPSRIEPLAVETLPGFQTTALAAGADLRVTDIVLTDLGDGDGNLEAGESFEVAVQVRNSGRLAEAGASVGIASADAELQITAGSTALGNVGSFASASNAVALALDVAPGALPGTPVTLTASVTYGGYTQSVDLAYVLGDARPFLRDSLETDVGWTAGLPGDTATTGIWEFGDPVGTSSSGQPANPEDDATPNPGVSCFTTGNGSTSAGGDDVDNGFTTLLSPNLDLSGASTAVLSYSRWFADLTTNDDVFQVDISDDGGASWSSLEAVTVNANAWNRVSFLVADHADLTSTVRLRFIASDSPNNSIVEGAVDELEVVVYDPTPLINLYGTPALGTPLAMHVLGEPGDFYSLHASQGTALIQRPNIVGPILIDPTGMFKLNAGTLPADGLQRREVTLPNDPILLGRTYFVQAATFGAQVQMSNRVSITFE